MPFKRVDGYLFLHPTDKKESLEKELAATKRAGLPTEMLAHVPSVEAEEGKSCIKFPEQGQFHIMKYLKGLSDAVIRLGGKIYTETKAEDITKEGAKANGFEIKATCWIRTTRDGSRMYVINSGENTVSVFNSSNAASPTLLQKLELKKSGPEYIVPGLGAFKTSEPFSLALSTSEKILYIVNQHTNKDFSIGNYNYLHYLDVNNDGTLTEESDPVQIPVPNTVRPKGSAVVMKDGNNGNNGINNKFLIRSLQYSDNIKQLRNYRDISVASFN